MLTEHGKLIGLERHAGHAQPVDLNSILRGCLRWITECAARTRVVRGLVEGRVERGTQ